MAPVTPSAQAVPLHGLEALARRAQAGDQQSLEELTQAVREPLRVFLSKRVRKEADADDLAQETLLRAYRSLDSYDPSRSFTTWLFTIGKNLAVNHGISERRRDTREQEAHSESPAQTELSHAGPTHLWQRAKSLLSDESYRALWLRYAHDASIQEVAAELGRTQVSTKVLLYRTRKRLLKELQS